MSPALATGDVTDNPTTETDIVDSSNDDVPVTDVSDAANNESSDAPANDGSTDASDAPANDESTDASDASIDDNSEAPSASVDENPEAPSVSADEASNDESQDSSSGTTESGQNSDQTATESSESEPEDSSSGTTEQNEDLQNDVNVTTEDAETDADETSSASIENASTQSNDESGTDSSTSNTSSDEQQEASSESSSTEAPAFTCTENGVGRFAHPGNCHEYYYCWDSVHGHVTFSCKSKVFDPVTKLCVNNWAHCESTPQCNADREVLADVDDKLSFFVCKLHPDPLNPGYIVQKEKCHDDREFDAELGFCKKVASESSSSSSESDESKEKFECEGNGIFIDITDETKFYQCTLKNVAKGKFKLSHHSCPKNQVFSLEDKLCIPV